MELVLLALLPALGLIIYGAREQRGNATAAAEAEALRLARILSASHQRLIHSTRHLLVALARLPEIRKAERAACAALLSDLIEEYPPYSNLGIADARGQVLCSARAQEGLSSLVHRPYFTRAVQEKRLFIGEYQTSAGKPVLNLGYPVMDAGGVLAAVVFAAIDLAWFNDIVASAELPENSNLTLYDREGRVLARYPDPERWVGKTAPNSRMFQKVLAISEGVTEAAGLDGTERLYGFTSFGAAPNHHDIYLTVGIPTTVALAGANWTMERNLIAGWVVSVIALMAAWCAGDTMILRPLKKLLDATARVASGDFSTRTGLAHTDDELGRLAASFDAMAQTLERERVEGEIANQRTQRSLQRIKALHEIDLAIASTLDLGALLEVLLGKIAPLLPNAAVTITLREKDGAVCAPAACRNIDEEQFRVVHGAAKTLTEEVLVSRLPLVLTDLRERLDSRDDRTFQQLGFVSYLGAPLIGKGHCLGVLSFYTKEKHLFENDDREFLVTVSGQLAMAIQNAQLYDETRRSASEIAALHALTLAATQSLDLDLILQEAIKKLTEIFSFAAIRVFLFDRNRDNLEVRAAYEARPQFRDYVKTPRRAGGIVVRVAESGESLIMEDVLTDARYAALSRSRNAIRAGTRFAALLPIKTKLKIWGTIVCVGERPRKLTPEEVRLLESMSNQIGIAVENSSLYQETAARAEELASLYSIVALAGESLDLEVVLKTTMMKVLETFEFDAARIYLCRGDAQELHLVAANGFPDDVQVVAKYRLGETRIGRAFESGTPRFVEDMETDADYQQTAAHRLMFKAGFRSSFIVPLKFRGVGVGVINFLKRRTHRFSERDRQLIHAIAYHLGIAVGNANLYSRIKEKTLELETANRAKDEFLGVMSHELRTPLNVIKGYTEVTRQKTFGELSAEQEYALEKIASHANDLSRMITGILQVTTLEAKAVKIARREVNPRDLLDELKTDYLVRANKNLEIVWEYPEYLPLLSTDDDKLRAILQNLINNALKFTEGGAITVSARHVAASQAIEFKVSDTGTGIAPEKLPLIFDMFKQVDSSATRKHEGVGLGLYIVKKFVDLLGGDIGVESELGRGSRFTVVLPLEPAGSKSAPPAPGIASAAQA
jgi:signal transduction histidine kinase/HAMP domain-containing protein